jgi:hypothetical protein
MGVTRQAGQIRKDSVVPQRRGGLDPSPPQDERVQQSFQRCADAGAVVSRSESNMTPEGALQVDALEEWLEQSHSAELSQTDSLGSNAKISDPTAHCCRTAFSMTLYHHDPNSYFRGSQQGFPKRL